MMMQPMGGRRSHARGASGNRAIAVCARCPGAGGRVTPIHRAIDALFVLDALARARCTARTRCTEPRRVASTVRDRRRDSDSPG